ncbi:hypothetical protein [Kitasatospora paranensis]|uniref:hypothetical protein n=1 Tax=Kitasatospora paranensis TaxID=258053 RepID=UPI0031F17154
MTGKQKALVAGAVLTPCVGFVLLLVVIVAVLNGSMSAQAGQAGQPGVVSSVAGIPPVLLSAYNNAVANLPKLRPNCAGMTWSLLAAIGEVESTQASGSSIAPNGDISPPIYGPLLDGSAPAATPRPSTTPPTRRGSFPAAAPTHGPPARCSSCRPPGSTTDRTATATAPATRRTSSTPP